MSEPAARAAPLPRVDFDAVKDAARGNRELAAYLAPGGRVRGQEYWARSPLRDDRHVGSFSIHLAKAVWHDRATGEGDDLVDLWRRVHGLSNRVEAARAMGVWLRVPAIERRPQAKAPVAAPRSNAADNTPFARELWQEAGDPRGTLVERYFERRKLQLTDDLCNRVIRFHPVCPWGTTRSERCSPAVLACFRPIDAKDDPGKEGLPIAIHRIFLTASGEPVRVTDGRGKTKNVKLALGPISGAAIKLDADEAVTHGLAITEGLEDALDVRQRGFRPMWCCGSAGAIATFPVLGGIEALTIFADNDPAGRNAALACADVWRAAGRAVAIIPPRSAKDWNAT